MRYIAILLLACLTSCVGMGYKRRTITIEGEKLTSKGFIRQIGRKIKFQTVEGQTITTTAIYRIDEK